MREDEVSVAWRVVESGRPDADYCTECRTPRDADWERRYVFRDWPRERSSVAATCESLATTPESPLTGDPVVCRATETGHVELTPDIVTRFEGTTPEERPEDETEFHYLATREFDLAYP